MTPPSPASKSRCIKFRQLRFFFAAEARYKRSVADLEAIAAEEAAANEIFGGGGGEDCQSKYSRCLAAAFKSGAEYVAAPGGITQ